MNGDLHRDRLVMRTAIEALRAGVPNRAAIALLGSVEDAIEERFDAGLKAAWSNAPSPGLLFAGGFGTGKSHLLGYLRELALRENFVVGAIAVSKETPLSSPLAMFAAAMRDTVVPGHADDAMTVALGELRRRPAAAEQLQAEVSGPDAGFSPIFPAILELLSRQITAELVRRIEAFLAGGKAPVPALRQALAQAGAKGRFDLARVTEASLALQRERFAALLFRAAGFAGWCVLIDEVELIGRYAPLQRARAYAELGRWLGLSSRIAGLYATAAITDDYASEVIAGREDAERLPDRLREKGTAAQAELASAAMRVIGSAPLLIPPTEADLLRHAEKLRRGYATAYGWDAPALPVGERRANRTMRHHIRGWITQWDVLRLQGRATGIETRALASNYTESESLDDANAASVATALDDRDDGVG